MYQIKMMNGDKFNIAEETFNKLAGQAGLILIPELGGIINLNSVTSILPKELSEQSGDRRTLNDGTVAIKKFGIWIDATSGARLDLNYYSELKSDVQPYKQIEFTNRKNIYEV